MRLLKDGAAGLININKDASPPHQVRVDPSVCVASIIQRQPGAGVDLPPSSWGSRSRSGLWVRSSDPTAAHQPLRPL